MDNSILKFRRWLLETIHPISNFITYFHFPWYKKKLSSKNYRECLALLEPGDVILTQSQGELANLFIPGFFSHACLYAGDGYVIEAVGKGVIKTDLIDVLLHRNDAMVRRPTFATEEQKKQAVAWAFSKLGAQYDLFFNPNNQAFYCSELVWLAYREAVGPEVPFALRTSLGLSTIMPDDIALADKYWETLYDTRS